MVKPLRIIRHLRLNDVEAWAIKRGFTGYPIAWMLLADYRRRSTLDDYPHLKGIEDASEIGRSNYVRVIVLHRDSLDGDTQEEILGLAGSLLDNKWSCDWSAFFEQIAHEEFDAMRESHAAMLASFERALQRHGFLIRLADIDEGRFNHLSQERVS